MPLSGLSGSVNHQLALPHGMRTCCGRVAIEIPHRGSRPQPRVCRRGDIPWVRWKSTAYPARVSHLGQPFQGRCQSQRPPRVFAFGGNPRLRCLTPSAYHFLDRCHLGTTDSHAAKARHRANSIRMVVGVACDRRRHRYTSRATPTDNRPNKPLHNNLRLLRSTVAATRAISAGLQP